MKYRDSKKLLNEPENVVLLAILFFTFCLLIHGETLIKIPRYYAVEISNDDGKKEWVFMKEGALYDNDQTGENNPFWEPPCIAEEDDDTNAGPQADGVNVEVADDLKGVTYEPLSDEYDALNDTALNPEQYDELLQINDKS